ncbi:hypothetical protein ABZ990_20095 [Streptomyces sp. NPDC046203]|uniref:hypothetical protein n=1 Tax=Streptomyces sp. NPDC046203 TaxID=3154602 RepID=UPI0033E4E379
MEQDAVKRVVLRRVSWMVISWVTVVGLGIGMIAAVYNVTSVHGFRTGWQGIPVFFLLAGITGRVANCKVILEEDVLTVVGPLRTHRIPATAIRDVVHETGGSLEIDLGQEETLPVFAFGGSLVDYYVGSSRDAHYTVKAWWRSARAKSESPAEGVRAGWTWCRPADLSLAVAVIGGLIGAGLAGGF